MGDLRKEERWELAIQENKQTGMDLMNACSIQIPCEDLFLTSQDGSGPSGVSQKLNGLRGFLLSCVYLPGNAHRVGALDLESGEMTPGSVSWLQPDLELVTGPF